MSFANPKGIVCFSPRLARQRLPWVRVWNRKQRQRRCGPQPNVAATPLRWVTHQTNRTTSTRLWQNRARWDGGNGRNRVAVEIFVWTVTQGSAFRATLGFGTESRWDSRRGEFESPHLSGNGAKSISTFVFPGGADLLLQRLIHKLKQRLRWRIVRQAEILVKFAVVGFF